MDQTSIKTAVEQIAEAGLTVSVLEKATAAEPRWWRKRRLLALICLAKGGSTKAACEIAKADSISIEKWLQAINEAGLAGLETHEDNSDFYRDQLAARKSELMLEILLALEEAEDARERTRLQAVYRVLTGEDAEIVAKSMGVVTRSVVDWQKRTLRRGIDALRARKQIKAQEKLQR